MLSVVVLEKSIKEIKSTSLEPPTANQQTAVNFANAITIYYTQAMAGAAAVTLNSSTLVPILKATLDSNTFLQKLGTSIQTWSLTWSWAGPGFTGPPGSTVAIGPDLDAQLSTFITKYLSSSKSGDSIKELSTIIHSWSKTIKVNLLNSSNTVVITMVT